MQAINLLKFITENGLTNDPKIMALLYASIRNPRYNDSLLRLLKPKMLENALYNDPFTPYPVQEEFEGEVEICIAGIHEPYLKEIYFAKD